MNLDSSNLKAFTFRKEFTYTFVTFQHIVSLASFNFMLGISKIDIQNIIGRAPLQLMSVYFDPQIHRENPPERWTYFWNVEVWHEKFLSLASDRDFKKPTEEDDEIDENYAVGL